MTERERLMQAVVERMAEAIENAIDWMPDMFPRSYLRIAAKEALAVAEPVVTTELTTLRAENARLRELLVEIETDAFWARSHAALRAKINDALKEPTP